MNTEKVQRDFERQIADNGFVFAGYTGDSGIAIYHRVWKRQENKLEARIMLSGIYILVTIKRNGRIDNKFIRDYTSPKRAMNAIRGIVLGTNFEWQNNITEVN